MPTLPSNSKGEAQHGVAGQIAKDASSFLSSQGAKGKVPPLQTTEPSAAHPGTGISDEVAKEAHDFILSSTRRMSDSQSPHSPGLTDELMKQTHVFWDSTATRRESHSKHIPDVTLPGMTDEVIEEALEFTESTEMRKE
jgi:hypothetical protein